MSVHCAVSLVGGVTGRSRPLEVSAHHTIHFGSYVSRLRNVARAHLPARDGSAQLIRRNALQSIVHVGQMPAVELVKVVVIGRAMFGSVPPVPVATFSD